MACTLVKFHADIAGDKLLAFSDSSLEHFAFRSIPETIVNHLGVDGNEAVAEVHDFFIHGDGFQSTVCMVKNGSARSFINTAGFHTDETVFDDIDSSDSVSCTEFVQAAHDVCGGEFFAVDCHRNTFFKGDDDIFGFISCFHEGLGQAVHIIFGSVPGIFEDTAFKADVEKVAVHAVGFFSGGSDRNIVFVSIFDHFGTSFECPVGIAPCSNDFDFGIESISCEFKTNLVISFTGCAVVRLLAVPFSLGTLPSNYYKPFRYAVCIISQIYVYCNKKRKGVSQIETLLFFFNIPLLNILRIFLRML